jgi:hypothetical protein
MSKEKPIKIKEVEEEKELPLLCQQTCISDKGCTCQNKNFK